MKSRTFRGLMIASAALLISAAAVNGMHAPAITEPFTGSLTSAAKFGVAFSITWIALFTLGFIGMFRYQSWGRLLSLVAAALVPIAAIVQSQLFGTPAASTSEPAIATALASLADMSWGAVLAVAYFSEISERFGANNSFKPSPLRGLGAG